MNDCATFVNSITELDACRNTFIEMGYEGKKGHKQGDSDDNPCYDTDSESEDTKITTLCFESLSPNYYTILVNTVSTSHTECILEYI